MLVLFKINLGKNRVILKQVFCIPKTYMEMSFFPNKKHLGNFKINPRWHKTLEILVPGSVY